MTIKKYVVYDDAKRFFLNHVEPESSAQFFGLELLAEVDRLRSERERLRKTLEEIATGNIPPEKALAIADWIYAHGGNTKALAKGEEEGS